VDHHSDVQHSDVWHSNLWLDQPDAHDRIDARGATGEISPEQASQLHGFVDNGYLTLSLGLDQQFCDALDDEIAELWKQRPRDLAVSPPGVGRPTSFRDYDGSAHEHGYRIPDLHSHSQRALDLYLSPQIFSLIELILGEPAIAFQSLYFEYGSMQGLHRDPMFVVTRPASHLFAAWIALEDITADSGPLSYVPGSHRLPWFEFEPDSIVCGQGVSQEKRLEFGAWRDRTMREKGLAAKPFTCKRGDVFIWHGGLVHGGTHIQNPQQTRKSFVVHYSSAANYRSRTARVQEREGDGWRTVPRTTETILERDGARGLDNPIHLT
jgi:phytanoyl-CoA hydroxylase